MHLLTISHQNAFPNPKDIVDRITPAIPIRMMGLRPHLLEVGRLQRRSNAKESGNHRMERHLFDLL